VSAWKMRVCVEYWSKWWLKFVKKCVEIVFDVRNFGNLFDFTEKIICVVIWARTSSSAVKMRRADVEKRKI
jgi:hypothetical protein